MAVCFLSINTSVVLALGSVTVDHADTGGAFTADVSGSYGGCGDTVGIRTSGNCTQTGWWETHTGGCGGVSRSQTFYLGNGVTGCKVQFGGGGTCYGCEPSWGSDVYVRVNQVVTISGAPASSLTGNPVNLSATVATKTFGIDTSGYNAINWSASGNCTVDGSGHVTNGFLTSSCIVTASVTGTTNNLYPASSQVSWTVGKRSQSLSVTNSLISTMPALSQDTVAATSAGGVTISSSGGCSGGGSNSAQITANNATSQCQVTFSAAENNYYYAAPQSPIVQTATVTKLNQTITFGAQTTRSYSPSDTFPLDPKPTASSNYAIDYLSGTPTVCSVSNVGIVTVITAGTCTIHADQPGDTPIYNAAARASRPIIINKVNQTITVTTPAPANAQVLDTFTVAATVGSGLGVAITSSGGCSGSGSGSALITINNGTDCTVNYNQAGNINYNAAAQVSSTTNITLPLQTMVVSTPAPSQEYVGNTYNVAAISYIKNTVTPTGKNVTITIAAAPNNGCLIQSGGTNSAVIKLTSGTTPCKVLYNQNGSGVYEPVAEQSNTTTAIRINQLINVTTAAPLSAVKNTTFSVAATASSPDGVTIVASGGCSGSGTNNATITMNSATSSCTVTYTQPGDDDYYPASTISSVTTDGTAPTISVVTPVPAQTNEHPEYTLYSNEAGSILYGGSCSSSADAIAGNTTIVFNTLAEGVYSNCTVQVRDAAGNLSNILSINSFTVVPDMTAFVKVGGTGDCTTWVNACGDIQQAISIPAVNEVWIAQGTYRPTSTITLKGGLSVYGGFIGNETTRVAKGGLTIVSGDTGSDDTVSANGLVTYRANIVGSNLNRLFTAVNQVESILLSGLSLNAAGGTAGGTVNGGGLRVSNSIVTVKNVQFIALAGNTGGAVSVEAGGKFTAADTSFIRNASTTGVGGAVSVNNNNTNVLSISNSLFDSNTAATDGGAINHPFGYMTLINSTFFGNATNNTSGKGGAINFGSIDSPSNAIIKYATFVNNSAGTTTGRGGAISIDNAGVTGQVNLFGTLVLNNTAFAGNNIAGMNNINDDGYNIVGYNGSSGMVNNNDVYEFVGTSSTAPSSFMDDILEVTLANNGGLTANLMLKADSYAQDRIPNTHVNCVSGTAVGVDQRSQSRPALVSENCDVGAYELEPLVSCADVSREKGYSLGFYPKSNVVCVGGSSLLSAGTVHPFYLVMLIVLGVLRVRKLRK